MQSDDQTTTDTQTAKSIAIQRSEMYEIGSVCVTCAVQWLVHGCIYIKVAQRLVICISVFFITLLVVLVI